MDIKDIIEEKINRNGLTKKVVAERMGIASQNLNSMITSPSWPTLERLAAALEMPIPQLISEQGDQEPITPTIVCPHCGMSIPISVGIKKGE